MGRRGPRTVNMQILLRLERDWNCNLRVLLQGVPSEGGPDGPTTLGMNNLVAVEERRDIWKNLIDARSVDEVRAACRQWKKFLARAIRQGTVLEDYSGMLRYPEVLSRYAVDFLHITKRDKRFPRAAYSDESKLVHISRGLAGAMMDLAPATAIDRLRKMKHGPGGPLWSSIEKRCCCWHCSPQPKYFDLFVPPKV